MESGVQKHLGRGSPLCLCLAPGGRHRAGQFGTVSVKTGCAVQDRCNFLVMEISQRT